MNKITRILEFDAAHRVMNHESKCATLHGHRYKVEIDATGSLDSIGRIIDFSALKTVIGGWIDKNWDHTTILFFDDFKTVSAISSLDGYKKPFLMASNPTAENMASYLLEKSNELMKDTGILITKVTIWETPNCKAESCLTL